MTDGTVWPVIGDAVHGVPVLRLYAACQPGAPVCHDGTFGLRPDPPHPAAPDGSLGVTARGLSSSPELFAAVTAWTPSGRPDRWEALVELFVRPLLRVFRASLELSGRPWADPARDDVVFELTPDRRPTGRIVITGRPDRPGAQPPSRLAALDALIEAYRAATATEPSRGTTDRADPVRELAAVLAGELRHLRQETAALLRADPRWAAYVHGVDPREAAAVQDVLDRLRALESTRRSTGGHTDRPVLAVPGRAEGLPGFARFRRDVFHVGAEVVDTASRPRGSTVVVLPDVGGLERPPRTWNGGAAAGPVLSRARSLADLELGELRENPLAEQYAVRWTWAQTTDLVDRLVGVAKEAAARTAENAVAARRRDADLPYAERVVRLVHHVLHRKQFRIGPAAHYPLEQARRDLLPTVERGAPLDLLMLYFSGKLSQGGLKAAGPMPDLAELASLVRMSELTAALRAVYPPGAVFTLLADGEHFRAHPELPLEAGVRVLRRYVDLVGTDDCVVEDYEDLARRRLAPEILAAHTERRAEIRREYTEGLTGLDVTKDPIAALRGAAAVDPRGNFGELYRSLLYSARMPEPESSPPSGWARTVYADPYDVGLEVPPEIRAARRALLRAAWQDTIDYVATWHADREFQHRRRVAPGAVLCTVTPRRGRLGLGLLGGAPIPPWHGTGAVDRRGLVSCDFLVSLRDQGYVPVYSPLLGAAQPFAMVPVTVTRVPAEGGSVLDSPTWSSIALRRR